MDGWQAEVGGMRGRDRIDRHTFWTLVCSGLLFLTLTTGFYVRTASGSSSQPAPYDLLLVLTMAFTFAVGLRFPRDLKTPAILWSVLLLGYAFSGISALYIDRVTDFLMVSVYLILSMFFFAALVVANPKRNLAIIWWAYTASAVLAAGLGCAAYFGLVPDAESFLKFSRVRSTFNDPNVFGPFLVGPTLFLIYRLSMSSQRRDLLLVPFVGLLFLGILLSFSRGAWGNLIFAGGVFLVLTWMTASSAKQIARLTLAVSLIGVLAACVVAWALSSDVVSELFEERFSLTQSYDVSEEGGRFAIQEQAIQTIIEKPFGIGPSQWAKIVGIDPHNVYLNVFLAGGWLSGTAYIALVLTTIFLGIRSCFAPLPFQGLQIIAVATFTAHVGEAFIIDIDNWRHVYLLMGLVWGGIAYVRIHSSEARTPTSASFQPRQADGFAA
jgi:O-antigen ligase